MDSQSGKARRNALVVVVNQPTTLPVLHTWCQLEDFSASHTNSVVFVQDFIETITTQGGKRQATRGRQREESNEKESNERKATSELITCNMMCWRKSDHARQQLQTNDRTRSSPCSAGSQGPRIDSNLEKRTRKYSDADAASVILVRCVISYFRAVLIKCFPDIDKNPTLQFPTPARS